MKNIHSILSKKIMSLQDVVVLALLAGLLLYGVSMGPSRDPLFYQCYALAFWQGPSGFEKLPLEQCSMISPDPGLTTISQERILHALQQWRLPSRLIQFVAAQSPDLPYHRLPNEYPLLSILPYSLGLQTLSDSYRVNFALWMIVFAGCIYLVLLRWRSRQAALAYCLYLVLAGWMTVAGRFDIVPAGLTLFAVICAQQKRWNWAFAFLALATLTKFYPAILLVPFLLVLQRETPGKWYAWRRWLPMAVFVGICLLIGGVSLLLSVTGTLTPLGYFIDRPMQVESLSASLLWIASVLWKTPLIYEVSFGSGNYVSPLSGHVTFVMILLLVIGLLSTWWLQWRGRIDLAMACLLTLLIIMVTGKVLSPQYLIWIIPLAAYVGQSNRWWLLFWPLAGLLTNWMYPYSDVNNTVLFSTIRNVLLLAFILTVLILRALLSCPLSSDEQDGKHPRRI